MKTLSPKGMKTLKIFHLIFIMMWSVGVAAMGLLYWRHSSCGLEFLYNQDTAMFFDYTLVIPGAILTVITGIIYGLKTKWGFFKYRWLTVKWITGITIILIGTFWLHPMSMEIIEQASAGASQTSNFPPDYFGTKLTIVNGMSIIQGIVLLFLIWISVLKPWNKK